MFLLALKYQNLKNFLQKANILLFCVTDTHIYLTRMSDLYMIRISDLVYGLTY